MNAGGLKAPVRNKIRDDICFKLLGNASFNSVSLLTHGTLEQIGTHGGARSAIKAITKEAAEFAEAFDVRLPMDMYIKPRSGGSTAVGAHNTSMLQDYDHGRPLELDALAGSVAEIGRLVGVVTPTLDSSLALCRLKADVTT